MSKDEQQLDKKWDWSTLLKHTLREELQNYKAHTEPAPQTLKNFKEQGEQLGQMSTDIAVINERGVARDKHTEEIKKIVTGISVMTNKMSNDIIRMTETNKTMSDLITKHDKALFDPKEGLIPLKDKIWGGIKTFMWLHSILFIIISSWVVYYIKDFKNTIMVDNAKMLKDEVPKAVQTALQDLDIEATLK